MEAVLNQSTIESNFIKVLQSLSEKERIVIERRIGLYWNKETLQNIGNSFTPSITRERVRQIEDAGIKKVGRIIKATDLSSIQDLARSIIATHGGVATRDKLIAAIIKEMSLPVEINSHIFEVIIQSDFEIIICKHDKIVFYISHTGAKTHFLSRNVNFVKNDNSEVWILGKLRIQKGEFCKNCGCQYVIFFFFW